MKPTGFTLYATYYVRYSHTTDENNKRPTHRVDLFTSCLIAD